MKVEGQYPKVPVQDKNVHKDKSATPVAGKKSAHLEKIETKQFSVNKIREKIDAEPDINLDRVKELKARIKKGEYDVDTRKLAGNILKDSLLEDL